MQEDKMWEDEMQEDKMGEVIYRRQKQKGGTSDFKQQWRDVILDTRRRNGSARVLRMYAVVRSTKLTRRCHACGQWTVGATNGLDVKVFSDER